MQLFIRPQLLYGIFQPTIISAVNDIQQDGRQEINRIASEPFPKIDALDTGEIEFQDLSLTIGHSESARYKKIVAHLFHEQQLFLNKDYSLERLVTDSKIPRHRLSVFINKKYGIGFREFINRYRVNFFKGHLNTPGWKNLTFEAIATECGHGSRSTFIKNFKGMEGISPSEFVKNNQKQKAA